MTVPISEVQPWSTVSVTGVVIEQSPGAARNQTLLFVPGVGGTGQWSIVRTALVDVIAEPDPLLAGAIAAAMQREKELPRAVEG